MSKAKGDVAFVHGTRVHQAHDEAPMPVGECILAIEGEGLFPCLQIDELAAYRPGAPITAVFARRQSLQDVIEALNLRARPPS